MASLLQCCYIIKDYVRIGNVTCTQYHGQSMTNTLQKLLVLGHAENSKTMCNAYTLLGSSLLGVHTSPYLKWGLMGMPDWDWVVLLSAVLLAVFSVDGVVSA